MSNSIRHSWGKINAKLDRCVTCGITRFTEMDVTRTRYIVTYHTGQEHLTIAPDCILKDKLVKKQLKLF